MAPVLSQKLGTVSSSLDIEEAQSNVKWEDVTCPICLDFPHNVVLLWCSSYNKGCRPFICDTDHSHSNCLDRFRSAYGATSVVKLPSVTNVASGETIEANALNSEGHPACPLCRGDIVGWVVIDEARVQLNTKKRCCEQKHCSYVGNYMELQKHTKLKHPHARPSEIDPIQQLDWDNLQQSLEIVDVLSIIHSEVPHGVVLGDYVIDYGHDETADDYEDYSGRVGKWWISCIFGKLFCRNSRNRRRPRQGESRRGGQHSSSSSSSLDEGAQASTEIAVYRYNRRGDEFLRTGFTAASREGPHLHSYRRRRHRYHDM